MRPAAWRLLLLVLTLDAACAARAGDTLVIGLALAQMHEEGRIAKIYVDAVAGLQISPLRKPPPAR